MNKKKLHQLLKKNLFHNKYLKIFFYYYFSFDLSALYKKFIKQKLSLNHVDALLDALYWFIFFYSLKFF